MDGGQDGRCHQGAVREGQEVKAVVDEVELGGPLEDLGDVQVIKPTGNLLHPESLDRLFESVAMWRGIRIVLDFSDVQFLSSAVLARLINLKKKVAASGGRVGLRNIHPDLREVFRLSRLDQVFDIEA